MKTVYCVSGHVGSNGIVVSDEAVPLDAGPVEILIKTPSADSHDVEADDVDDRALQIRIKQWEQIREALAVRGKRKSKPMSDIDEAIYGPKAPLKKREG